MLPIFFLFGTTILFGFLAIFFSIRDEKQKKELLKRSEDQKRRLYEITILKAIQDRIGYSLDSEKVVDTLTSSLKNLFPFSTASALIWEDDKLVFKCIIDEAVNSRFIEDVKKSMLASLSTIADRTLPQQIEEVRLGMPIDETNQKPIASFFHIPLVVNARAVGLINISSTTPGLYKDEDMTILYQMTNQASTALSRLEQVINTEEGKILAMLGSLSDGIFMVDKDNKLTLVNETAKQLLKISTSTPTIFEITSVLSRNGDFGSKIQQVLQENKSLDLPEVAIDDHILQVTITPVVEAAEEQPNQTTTTQNLHVIGASVMLHDITLEKSMSKLKEDFTAAIVHELRSPLTAIKAGSALLLTDKEHLDPDQEKKLIQVINQQSMRMLSDINSLLDAAKLESGHFTIFQKVGEISDVLQDSISLFAAEAREKQISIQLDLEPNLPRGYYDPTRIEQVINNLISNSLKFTPAGGTLMIKARRHFNEYLPKTTTNPGIVISVADTGIGIPKDKQSKLFSKFAQIENIGYIHGMEGTGLGLYIAKGIVEAHGGSIFLQSIPQHGTTVSFTLPIAKDIQQMIPANPENRIQPLTLVN